MQVCELELGAVHAAEDLGCSDPTRDACEAAVDEAHDSVGERSVSGAMGRGRAERLTRTLLLLRGSLGTKRSQ